MDTPKKPEANPPPSQTPREGGNPDKQNPEEPRRYDEADPNWRNPDVQMRNPNVNSQVNVPKGPL